MKKTIIISILALALTTQLAEAKSTETLNMFYKLSDFYFRKYVHNGLVNYQFANSNGKEIEALYKMIGDIDLNGATDNEKRAFYINAYNLIVIKQVVASYPIEKPMDEEGFFDEKIHLVAGEKLTLNQLEINKMLKSFGDPRFQFVLACAAMSCPQLANFAYTPDNIEMKLNERTKLALNDNRFIRINANDHKIRISKIFEWYSEDFKSTGKDLLAYINDYRVNKIPPSYSIEYYQYDWRLNERKG